MLRLVHPAFELRERLAGAILTGRDAGMPFYGPAQAAAFVGAISPADPSGPYGTDVEFSAAASGPLTWSIAGGAGSINSSTGVYTPGYDSETIRAALTGTPAIYMETTFTLTTLMLDLYAGTNGDPIDGRTASPIAVGSNWAKHTLGGSAVCEIWGNKARITQGGGGGTVADVIDCFAADGAFHLRDCQTNDAEHTLDLIFRYADTNNFWLLSLYIAGGSLRIIEKAAGVATLKAQTTGLSVAVDTDYDLKVVFDGASIAGYLDGANVVNYGSAATGLSATKHGCGVTNSKPLAVGLYGEAQFDPA